MEPGDQRLNPEQTAYINVGRIGRAHGVRGELRVTVLTDFPDERFAKGSLLYVGRETDPMPTRAVVEEMRPHRDVLLVKFDIAHTREEAAALAGSFVRIPASEAMPLSDEEFYEHELVGLSVVTDDGRTVGEVVRLVETGTADVLEIAGTSGKTRLVPMTAEFVAEIDLDGGQITIVPVPGLLD